MQKEARARLKINDLLIKSGRRFFDEVKGKANVQVETNIKIFDEGSELGDNFEKVKGGFVDYLLLDDKGFPICVLEAKSEDKDPLVGKEQARAYAHSQNVRFIILSNGNIHYFWDEKKDNPKRISYFPTLETLKSLETLESLDDFKPEPKKITDEVVDFDYIARSQNPRFDEDPRRKDESKRGDYLYERGYRILRQYQLEAVRSVQNAISEGKNRFLWEMATGTGKTLTAVALIKLFLRSGQAQRVLFLVDRLELEEQARKDLVKYLGNDYQTVVYKENKDDRRKAEIVVTTIQSLSYDNKYLKLFSPSDFDLVISDEAHRSISGSHRAIFEYFSCYKLGLTATPKDYLKNLDKKKVAEEDPRQIERRQLLSTYVTFGCESGEPTFRYSLLDGVKDGYLVNPISLDCRTEITTQLLSDEGYAVQQETDEGEEEIIYKGRNFERTFFSEETNRSFCKIFMENAEKDPISGEIGKTIFFCVSRKHATKITQILNEMAHEMFPGKYNSDFAIQITSDIPTAQQGTINFANDNLNGHSRFLEGYLSSKARVCVTVGMMTTGYDCQNILNLCLARPIFSPSDFVQIKGRGTRTYTFKYAFKKGTETLQKEEKKTHFKLFDFFANCEYFEEKYPYDEVLKLPKPGKKKTNTGGEITTIAGKFESEKFDPIKEIRKFVIGESGMRIDRELYTSGFEKTVKEHFQTSKEFEEAVNSGDYEQMESYVRANIFDRPKEYYNIINLREGYKGKTDRRLGLWEILDLIFGKIDKFKTKDDVAQEEFDKFIVSNHMIDQSKFYAAKEFFKSYLINEMFRANVNNKNFREYADQPAIYDIFKVLGKDTMAELVDYIQDNVNEKNFY
ncbi:MAG TPA: DEAD/DEAH box helicase family protein [Candidatus Absconditabacterales bacterium]|nr:DEAD/DEAH box helicase family protein [Candidatus Absconditabacterales bacterium]HOQ78913.1 DEAD/DEAH box helicase family protein [Candidatus Absconditabacterales bacterium]HPK28304.1 DEAD/DEAH box helicase family protein [Candidatus Absconditabacterales bacterium]